MRLRLRQVLCSNCKQSIHDTVVNVRTTNENNNTASQDSNPGSRSRYSEALPLSYCALQTYQVVVNGFLPTIVFKQVKNKIVDICLILASCTIAHHRNKSLDGSFIDNSTSICNLVSYTKPNLAHVQSLLWQEHSLDQQTFTKVKQYLVLSMIVGLMSGWDISIRTCWL